MYILNYLKYDVYINIIFKISLTNKEKKSESLDS